ncbi:hypothetical protein PLESTB_000030900 [Pleodorina starrii]|uniref:Uncharacterized protein n=1 Tax=Pleodorina starrii TaxID=330485 RepID=A0A9W6EXB5_9CHLO|nr:hypothetical protein PLESTM_001103400 [Pleodorina starrii]GLC47836.1 hypothetical protein PLESTB_000030900 [Pleodorina starrii]GLC70739.1 hypothetical protein PLESTF_001028200 [Pleodorina starrii]
MAPTSPIDAAFGAMLGAFVGDATGAVLEFDEKHICAETVERALTMPGGGVWGVGPGQITDDSELAMALATGLSGHEPAAGFPAEAVAQKYGAWLESHPFDVGNTCRTAFSAALHHKDEDGPLAPAMRKQSQFSRGSKSNGSLMRITPLAVWGCRLSDEDLAAAAVEDARLSHPNEVTQQTTAIYCIAIKHLIANPGDADGAIAAASAWAAGHACEEVAGWLRDALGSEPGPAVDRHIGFVRYGFFYAFRHLKLRTQYREALREVLLLKGDTDTNAAIVGGLLGALHGASGIPQHMAAAVLGRLGQADARGPKRPDWLQPGKLPVLFAELYGRATGTAVDVQALPGVPPAAAADAGAAC